MNKKELIKLLGLNDDADLAAVREAVRGLDNRALDAVAAQAVMGWELDWHPGGVHHFHAKNGMVVYPENLRYSDSLDAAAALMPKIEEMGLSDVWCSEMILMILGQDADHAVLFTSSEVENIANATPRQRTIAAVLAVAGRVFQ